MKTSRQSSGTTMRKYYQLILVAVSCISVITLLIYRHEYYRLRYVLEVLNIFGKPGIAQIEFCGPGFNATLLSEILRSSSFEIRETPPLFQEINEDFYSYSSFLRSYQKHESLKPLHVHNIDTIVIGKAHATPNFRCNIWLENNSKPKTGRFTFKVISDPINDYQLLIFHCSMNKDLGQPVGISFYVNDYNVNPIHAPINKVIQVNTKINLKESKTIKFINNVEPAICVVPNKVPVVSRDALMQFLVFHHMIGVNYFTIYDSMISEDTMSRLNLLPSTITQWNIHFFPLNYPFVFAKSYDVVRKAVELDCLLRHFRIDIEESNKASHAIVLSWDEFLVPRIHDNIKSVLADFDRTRKIESIEVKPLIFCLNQDDDDSLDINLDIIKKTHYYILPQGEKSIYIQNFGSMAQFEDIFHISNNTKHIPIETLGMHKYVECRDPKSYHPNGASYNETQMQVFQHKFEGAMLKFGQSLESDKIYKMYTSGQIWETDSKGKVREML